MLFLRGEGHDLLDVLSFSKVSSPLCKKAKNTISHFTIQYTEKNIQNSIILGSDLRYNENSTDIVRLNM